MRIRIKPLKRDWHRWFAWYPVKIAAEWAWLEWVERKPRPGPLGAFSGWLYRDTRA